MSFWRKIAGLAARNLDEAECDVCPPGLPGEDPAFSTADAFSQVFQSDAASEGNVRRLYQLARQTTRGFESYARRLEKRYRACPQLLEDVLDGLFFVATSDGVVTGDELTYLARVSELFGQSPLVFRRLKATHLGPEAGDPYVVLGVAHDASDADLRAAWRAMLSESHPDRARGRGLPPEFIEVAEAKAAAINAAFDTAMRERRALSLQGAA
jgi:DnaJ like chaperone protein